MEEIRRAAREHLKEANFDAKTNFNPAIIPVPGGLDLLWEDVSSRKATNHSEICENLLVAQGYLEAWESRPLSENDKKAANQLYDWASTIALPPSEFAGVEDWSGEKKDAVKNDRLRLTLAVSVLACLSSLLPIQDADNGPDVILALASFTHEKDPWNTRESFSQSTSVLEMYATERRSKDDHSFWFVVEYILKERIKPLFNKTRNPAITAAGRKNLHPVPLPRFDASVFEPETRPWKTRHVYATTVFSWTISQHLPTDQSRIESHLSLLVPPLLTLIDDEVLPFKTRGCNLLSQLLIPIWKSKSDILRRTNLSSVFEEALIPCLHSLPSITPEEESLQLLGAAYPALLFLLETSYRNPPLASEPTKPSHSHSKFPPKSQQISKDNHTYITSITRILRTNIIPSFHHISSTNPTSVSLLASFPHPRLSTFLLEQMTIAINNLQLHATKYLQELIPVVYGTLSNPFGAAFPPLLLAATTATRAVVINAHPRLWRWRGEILAGLCSCWLHTLEERERIDEQAAAGKGSDSESVSVAGDLVRLRTQLKDVVYLLKVALQNPIPVHGVLDAGQEEAKEKIEGEFQELIDADDDLWELLVVEIKSEDVKKFF